MELVDEDINRAMIITTTTSKVQSTLAGIKSRLRSTEEKNQ